MGICLLNKSQGWGFSIFWEDLEEEDKEKLYVYKYVGLVVNLQLIGPSFPRICFCFKPVPVLTCCLFRIQSEIKSISIGPRLLILFVWFHILSWKNSGSGCSKPD